MMLEYVLKRFFSFVPTLFIVAVILFFIKTILPGDPVDKMMMVDGELDIESPAYLSEYKKVQQRLGLDEPAFYFSIVPYSYPQNLSGIIPQYSRKKVIDDYHKTHRFERPRIDWNGSQNQFHIWITSFIKGDWGQSTIDQKQVSSKVSVAIKWTFFLLILSLVLAISISIPFGFWLSQGKTNFIKIILEKWSYLFFAIPLFWLCTLAVVFLTTDQYGTWTNWFPSIGLDPSYQRFSFWEGISRYGNKLILPAICWTLHSMAYMSTQLKVSMQNQLSMDYLVTAYAKGLSRAQGAKKHAFKNAMIPMITLIIGSIPGAMAGSIIIENIFNIPGMGRLLITAIYESDWNIVMAIVMITAFITMLCYLVADVLYSVVNPKIKWKNK